MSDTMVTMDIKIAIEPAVDAKTFNWSVVITLKGIGGPAEFSQRGVAETYDNAKMVAETAADTMAKNINMAMPIEPYPYTPKP